MEEKIVQFNFQCVRTSLSNINQLSQKLRELLQESLGLLPHLKLLYALIGETRDIIDGKGEYTLAYMMILTWYEFFPELAVFAIRTFVNDDIHPTESSHPYGSWKDIKYLCTYIKDQTNDPNHPLIHNAIDIMNEQIRIDSQKTSNVSLSLAGKWVARQGNTKFGWLFNKLAERYFPEYIESANKSNPVTRINTLRKASLKARTEYRKLCSSLNNKLDTIQIKQCANVWETIDHSKTTSITVSKQKKALLNVTKKGDQRSYEEDRIQCADNFKTYIDTLTKEGKDVKGTRIAMADFTKTGLELIKKSPNDSNTKIEIEILNSQWRDNGKLTGALGNMIAMVDTSGSMEGYPLLVALALGIRIAEKSALGKRVLTFNSNPKWISLENKNTFVEMLKTAKDTDWGMNTNFYAALDLIATAIRESKTVTKLDCQNMVLVILSDMQMDNGDNMWKSVYAGIKSVYAKLGKDKFGEPITPPHILFWNLRSTSGTPSLSSQPNASMMSGFSPALLNFFCEHGMEALQSSTPWSMLKESLETPRYAVLCNKV